MNLLERLQKLAASSAALREAHLLKEGGFATALSGLGKSIANTTAKAGTALGKAYTNQVKRHGAVSATLGSGMALSTAAAAPAAAAATYKNNKAGFRPQPGTE